MDKITILYNTCDKYECLWEGFFTLLHKYWRVDYLKSILRTYENPWQFEISGSFRSA